MDRRFFLTFFLCSVLWIFFWEVRWKKGKESQIEEWLQGHRLSQYGHLFEGELLGNSIFDLKKQKTKQHYPHFIDLFGRIKFIFSAIWTRTLPKDRLFSPWGPLADVVYFFQPCSYSTHNINDVSWISSRFDLGYFRAFELIL